MADLDFKESNLSVQLVGDDELSHVKVSANKDIGSSDIQDNGFDHAAVDITTTETLLNVSGSNRLERKELLLENVGNKTIYIGKTGVSSTDANASRGLTLEIGASRSFAYGPGLSLYAITKTGTGRLIIWESS